MTSTFPHGVTSLSAVLGATALIAAAVSLPSSAQTRSETTAAPAASPSGTIRWRACPSDAQPTKQCASMTVPRVYGRLRSGAFRIALARIPASGTAAQRIGSLLWDAGGPGGASTAGIDQIAARMSPAIRARFDFVAFDPRGIGASTPALASCDGPWPAKRPARSDVARWGKVQHASARDLARANRVCASPALAQSMGTVDVVRDLERLRRALGDEQLTFWGTSYGTRIAYVYAYRYPQRVRAMVLDGSIDPTGDYAGLPKIGGRSQDSALRFMKRHYRVGYRAIVRVAAELTEAPVRLDDGTRYTRWNWLDFTGGLVSFQDAWPALAHVADVVGAARGDGSRAAEARAALLRWKDQPNTNEGGGFSVVNCLDYADRLSDRTQARIARDVERESPVFGGSLALEYAMGCEGLGRLDPDPVPTITTKAQRDRLADVPVLLANATHDGATPMAWAKRMQRAFDRPMIKYRSGQHVIWGAVPSTCVNRPIDRFVIAGTLPKRDRTCPFVPPAPADAAPATKHWAYDDGIR